MSTQSPDGNDCEECVAVGIEESDSLRAARRRTGPADMPCMGNTPAIPDLPRTAVLRYWPIVGPSDDSALNLGKLISLLPG
jgi:hypothetical protein